MIGNQRWAEGRASYRRPDEPIATRLHDVVELAADRDVRDFIRTHHYSRSMPAARFRFGLLERGELVGVAVFSHPMRDQVLSNVFPALPRGAAVELGRFVLLDRVPGNGETWFLARTFELLRGRVAGVVSFSDPVPRATADGAIVMPGHVGTIYQASNGTYLGRARGDTLRLLPDGRVLSRRTYQKIRDAARGWRAAVEELERYGAAPLAADADELARRRWLAEQMARLTRPMRHPGNHRYAWVIDRRARRHDPTRHPLRAYPKERDRAIAA